MDAIGSGLLAWLAGAIVGQRSPRSDGSIRRMRSQLGGLEFRQAQTRKHLARLSADIKQMRSELIALEESQRVDRMLLHQILATLQRHGITVNEK